jgi:hypothetical protein
VASPRPSCYGPGGAAWRPGVSDRQQTAGIVSSTAYDRWYCVLGPPTSLHAVTPGSAKLWASDRCGLSRDHLQVVPHWASDRCGLSRDHLQVVPQWAGDRGGLPRDHSQVVPQQKLAYYLDPPVLSPVTSPSPRILATPRPRQVSTMVDNLSIDTTTLPHDREAPHSPSPCYQDTSSDNDAICVHYTVVRTWHLST